MTNLGVTRNVWRDWVKRDVDEAEMRALTLELVTPLYKQRYWDACKCDDLPRGVDYAVFDAAVNMGSIGRALARRLEGFDMQISYCNRSARNDSAVRDRGSSRVRIRVAFRSLRLSGGISASTGRSRVVSTSGLLRSLESSRSVNMT